MKETASIESSIPRQPKPARPSSFSARFGIIESDEKRFRQFKNRTLDTIDHVLSTKILANPQLEREYLHSLGRPCPTTKTPNLLATSAVLAHLGGVDFAESAIFQSLYQEDSLVEYCRCLDALFHLPLSQADLQALFNSFTTDLRLSSIGIRIAHYGECYGLYRKGIRVLDERVVDADLEWLVNYPKASAAFEKALAQSSDSTKQREMLDSLRISLENLLQQLLDHPTTSLEKNIDDLLKWMKGHGANTETREMTRQLLNSYCLYQNKHVKHGDGWKPAEVDYIFYLTATFIHLLAELSSSTGDAS